MEMVKVDIQKLQLLNDRIALTLDALNQVRMSAHGIHHTQASPWGYGTGYGSSFTQPVGFMSPYLPYAAQSPFTGVPFASPFYGGIQHTATPFTNPYLTGISPVASTLGAWSMPYVGNGISHTAFDPSWQMRAAQVLPIAQTPFTQTPFTQTPFTQTPFAQSPYPVQIA